MSRDNYILNNRKKTIYSLISSKNYTPMREKEIAALLDIPRAKRKELSEVLDILVSERKIEKTLSGKYQKYRSPSGIDDRSAGRKPSSRRRDGNAGKNAVSVGGFSEGDRRGRKIRTGGYYDRSILAPDPYEEVSGIVKSYGIPEEFSPRAGQMAQRCPSCVSGEDMAGRLDLRNHTVITIDGIDSKDLDDAVSLERSGSSYILGVHIADVGNYVPYGSALDRDAEKRGTSVYLPDRVIPMLPERLSNGICSLNEGEDRLTVSCILKISRSGEILSGRIVESVICSAHRMNYPDVEKILTEHDADLSETYRDIVPMLFEMKNLADILENMRRKRGMIDFSFPETKIELDENGHPTRIYPEYATVSTRMIEQFMLTANEFTAETYAKKEIPFLYRVHETPDPEKMEDVLYLIRKTDPEGNIPAIGTIRDVRPSEVQALLRSEEGKPEGPMISSMILRAMKQARYSDSCIGHFGIAAPYYCHFTSPIRRYPDLVIHRIIKDDLNGRLSEKRLLEYGRKMEEIAWKASARERRAAEAERETVKLKMAMYASEHADEIYEGTITSVTGWGLYVQLDSTLEGLVHVMTLTDDFYDLDEDTLELAGRTGGKRYRIGQMVKVRILRGDTGKRTVDFSLEEESEDA